jgi:arylsulfatase
LSEICKARGYATAAFGKWHLGHQPPFLPPRQGFDVFAGLPYSNDNGPLHPTVRGIPPLPWYENETVIERDPDQSQFTRRITERAVQFIVANRDRPFFLYLPHIMPHVPISASQSFRGRSRAGLYGDVVQELDWSVGEVVKALRDAGVERDTLVMFLSDNGPFLSYGTHAGSSGPFREGKLTAFEGGVRVPFMARWPGRVPAGRTSDEFITSLDLLPSIARLMGAELPKARIDGQDLSGVLLGSTGAKARDTFLYYSGRELHAVRKGRWKLHLAHDYLTVDGPPGHDGKPANFANMKPNAIEESGVRGIASRHGYKVEKLAQSLFDLVNDPGERNDRAAPHPAVVKELLALAEEARRDLGDALVNARGANTR